MGSRKENGGAEVRRRGARAPEVLEVVDEGWAGGAEGGEGVKGDARDGGQQEVGREPGGGPAVAQSAAGGLAGDDAFIFAWGRANAYANRLSRFLTAALAATFVMACLVAWLAWRNEQKETYVFVRDRLGHVVQADPTAFLHSGDARTETEIKAFSRTWVLDAFSWTPLDVEDRIKATLALVDAKAHGVVKAGLRLAERKDLVDGGFSGRVRDDEQHELQAVIERTEPLRVMVALDRYVVDATGGRRELGGLMVRVALREVPRSPANPHGLLVVNAQFSQRL